MDSKVEIQQARELVQAEPSAELSPISKLTLVSGLTEVLIIASIPFIGDKLRGRMNSSPG